MCKTIGKLATRYTTGSKFDAFTGFYYARARLYDPQIGRFGSEDPIGLNGGINQFGYVGGNPINFTDPTGLDKGWGSQFADWADGYVNSVQNGLQADYDTFGWGGKFAIDSYVGMNADVLRLLYDPLRVGDGLGCAIYGNNISAFHRGLLVLQDVGRATAIYGAVSGVASKAVGLAAREGTLIESLPCLRCFEADTTVQTESGLKSIDKISTDDKVLSYNTETGEMSYQPVLEKFARFADDIYTIKIEGEEKGLNVTREHPFYTKIYRDGVSTDAEWKEVKNLKANDQIKLASGNWAKILDVKFKGKGQVYNFSVANNHDYFVGDSRLLTHNNNPCHPEILSILEEPGALKVADKLTGNRLTAYEKIKDMLAWQKTGGNQHLLKRELKGMSGIDLPGGGKGRGKDRVVYSIEEGKRVIIHWIGDYH